MASAEPVLLYFVTMYDHEDDEWDYVCYCESETEAQEVIVTLAKEIEAEKGDSKIETFTKRTDSKIEIYEKTRGVVWDSELDLATTLTYHEIHPAAVLRHMEAPVRADR